MRYPGNLVGLLIGDSILGYHGSLHRRSGTETDPKIRKLILEKVKSNRKV